MVRKKCYVFWFFTISVMQNIRGYISTHNVEVIIAGIL